MIWLFWPDLLCSGYNSSGYCIRYNFSVSVSISATFFSLVAVSVSATFWPVAAKVFATFFVKPLSLLFRYFWRSLARISRIFSGFGATFRHFSRIFGFFLSLSTFDMKIIKITIQILKNCYITSLKGETK